MMKRFPVIFILLSILGMTFDACSNNDCSLTTVALGHFDFLDSRTHSPVSLSSGITISGFTIADVTIRDTLDNGSIIEREVKDSLLNDTLLYNNPTTSMSLPLSYNSKTTYVIHYTDKMRDTIELEHTNIPFLDNIECGTMMFYKVNNIKYTTNVLDSIVIVNPNINNEEKRNFNIYYLAN